MARSVRCWVTDRQTDTHDNYSNPRYACTPKVNNVLLTIGPLTMKLGTLMYHKKSSSNHKLQVCTQTKGLRQQKRVNDVCAYNLLMVGPLTMKLSTLMYHDESSSKN